MNLYERIPNNVNLSEDKKLQRALEKWLPNYLDWWQEMGPDGFQQKDVYLRTAISVEPDGWANFDFVKMPIIVGEIFLKPAEPGATIGFGDNYGQPLIRKCPANFGTRCAASSSPRATPNLLRSNSNANSGKPARRFTISGICFR